ncbi:hypothetical protein HK104_007097 [Borealophlyctis nickersoniae]|nr:hypothetical protein HK104_007097 [Borealophlyctis nickersoniae]
MGKGGYTPNDLETEALRTVRTVLKLWDELYFSKRRVESAAPSHRPTASLEHAGGGGEEEQPSVGDGGALDERSDQADQINGEEAVIPAGENNGEEEEYVPPEPDLDEDLPAPAVEEDVVEEDLGPPEPDLDEEEETTPQNDAPTVGEETGMTEPGVPVATAKSMSISSHLKDGSSRPPTGKASKSPPSGRDTPTANGSKPGSARNSRTSLARPSSSSSTPSNAAQPESAGDYSDPDMDRDETANQSGVKLPSLPGTRPASSASWSSIAETPPLEWKFYTRHRGTRVDGGEAGTTNGAVQFLTTWSQPHSKEPVPRATAGVWFVYEKPNVGTGAEQASIFSECVWRVRCYPHKSETPPAPFAKKTSSQRPVTAPAASTSLFSTPTLTYRFEHHTATHTIPMPLPFDRSTLANVMPKGAPSDLGNPAKRLPEMITSKLRVSDAIAQGKLLRSRSSHLKSQSLALVPEGAGEAEGTSEVNDGETSTIVADRSVLLSDPTTSAFAKAGMGQERETRPRTGLVSSAAVEAGIDVASRWRRLSMISAPVRRVDAFTIMTRDYLSPEEIASAPSVPWAVPDFRVSPVELKQKRAARKGAREARRAAEREREEKERKEREEAERLEEKERERAARPSTAALAGKFPSRSKELMSSDSTTLASGGSIKTSLAAIGTRSRPPSGSRSGTIDRPQSGRLETSTPLGSDKGANFRIPLGTEVQQGSLPAILPSHRRSTTADLLESASMAMAMSSRRPSTASAYTGPSRTVPSEAKVSQELLGADKVDSTSANQVDTEMALGPVEDPRRDMQEVGLGQYTDNENGKEAEGATQEPEKKVVEEKDDVVGNDIVEDLMGETVNESEEGELVTEPEDQELAVTAGESPEEANEIVNE